MSAPRRLRLGLAYAGVLFVSWFVLLNLDARSSLAAPRLRSAEQAVLVDEDLELARRYAPWILHAAHPGRGRQDVPTRIDYDGDLLGDNNWDDLPFFELPPTVYYALVETESHWFLTYHLFHPRDWASVRLGLNDTHENDGENLQVVVEKASGRPQLLFTQAHFDGVAHAAAHASFAEGADVLRGELLCADESGAFGPAGTPAAVFVESPVEWYSVRRKAA